MEEWRLIPDFENYEVSNFGNVRRGERVLKPRRRTEPYGYIEVSMGLCKNNKQKFFTVSRLVAAAFVPNPDGKPTVDHIDRDSTNNHVSNLRWATQHEQNMNRNMPLAISGHRHIYKKRNGWRVSIDRHCVRVLDKYCPTIEEAIAARDAFLISEQSVE